MMSFPIRFVGTLAAAILTGSMASAAPRIDVQTRLQHCGAETCLMVTGRRPDAGTPVMLAGHPVSVTGQRNWRVAVPLATVRTWFLQYARVISVRVGGTDGLETAVPLPIGLLGSSVELASLEVRAH
jgi:hypothetical protein